MVPGLVSQEIELFPTTPHPPSLFVKHAALQEVYMANTVAKPLSGPEHVEARRNSPVPSTRYQTSFDVPVASPHCVFEGVAKTVDPKMGSVFGTT